MRVLQNLHLSLFEYRLSKKRDLSWYLRHDQRKRSLPGFDLCLLTATLLSTETVIHLNTKVYKWSIQFPVKDEAHEQIESYGFKLGSPSTASNTVHYDFPYRHYVKHGATVFIKQMFLAKPVVFQLVKETVAYRRGEGVFKPPTSKFRRPSKIVPNSTRSWKLLKIAEFRTPTHQDVRKKGSKTPKLPRFTLVLH